MSKAQSVTGRAKGVRPAMRTVALEGLFASASDFFAVPYVSLFALSLGASKTQIGLIAAVTALLGGVMQLPITVITEGRWSRKYWCVLSSLVARGLWIPIALIPFYASGQRAIWLFVALIALRSLGSALGLPAWTTLVADIVPRGLRGRFFSYRNILVNMAGLVSVLIGGWLIRTWGAPLGYQVSFLAASACGLVAVVVFSRLEEPQSVGEAQRTPRSVEDHLSLRQRLTMVRAHLKQERQFTRYAITALFWNAGLSLPQPLFSLYFVQELGGADYLWGLLSATGTLSTVFGQRYWGPLADRFGGQRIMIISGLGAMSVPLLYWLAPDYRYVFAFNVVTAFAWAGYNLGAFNLLLEITPNERRGTYVAGYNGLVGLASAVSPLIGGLLAENVGIHPTFFLSFALRLTGWLLFILLVRPPSGEPIDWRQFIPGMRYR